MRKVVITLAMLLALGGAQELAAQVENATASIEIPELLSIGVTNTSVTFDQPAVADWDLGFIGASSGASTVSTRGNVTHRVTIEADAATMTYTGSHTDPGKVAGDLQWDAGSGFAGLTTGGADVVTGLTPGSHAAAAAVTYQMLLDEAQDVPGTYSLGFTYTVVAN
ncbi:MAG TPA: hypothetical protein VK966_10150 [Longimicrobiales bacterium]|nr:hypothetical protein [Longimicrobiales bacterium]